MKKAAKKRTHVDLVVVEEHHEGIQGLNKYLLHIYRSTYVAPYWCEDKKFLFLNIYKDHAEGGYICWNWIKSNLWRS